MLRVISDLVVFFLLYIIKEYLIVTYVNRLSIFGLFLYAFLHGGSKWWGWLVLLPWTNSGSRFIYCFVRLPTAAVQCRTTYTREYQKYVVSTVLLLVCENFFKKNKTKTRPGQNILYMPN